MAGAQRPFWMHQLVEYVLGAALITFGARDPTPIVPCVAGGLIILNAAITRGPLAAFRGIPRRLHRSIDVAIIIFTLLAAVQPFVEEEPAARSIVGIIALVHAFVWWNTSFAERVPRASRASKAGGAGATATAGAKETTPAESAAGDKATELGRVAGRVVGSGVNAVRRRQRR